MSVTRYELHPYKSIMNENDEGEWIKYDEIMNILGMQNNLIDDYSRQIYKLEAKIAQYEMVPKYLVTPDDIKNGYSIGAKEGLEN